MNLNDISLDMFTGLTETTKMLVVRGLKPELATAINSINVKFAQSATVGPVELIGVNKITPPICDIMNAFRACPIEITRVVLIGQDPYTALGVAMGMSFGARNKVPPSLKNIYKCLHYNGLIKQIPTSGDLTPWASQGILLLNAALTTIVGKSNEHATEWEPYTDALIRDISLIARPLIFILLGKFAQSKVRIIKNQHIHSILQWGHPSPLNSANTDIANPSNFIHCTAFNQTNEILIARGDNPIIWDIPTFTPVGDLTNDKAINALTQPIPLGLVVSIVRKLLPADLTPPISLSANCLWAFTDGGALANGKSHCKASWGFYITCGDYCAEDGGVVPLIDIPGQVFKTSNQRAELLALLKCLEFISSIGLNSEMVGFTTVTIVTDSEYSINCISTWYAGWIKKPEYLLTRKNTDIIAPAYYLLELLKTKYNITLQHIRSHPTKKDIPSAGTMAWFLYKGNDIVDKICEKINI